MRVAPVPSQTAIVDLRAFVLLLFLGVGWIARRKKSPLKGYKRGIFPPRARCIGQEKVTGETHKRPTAEKSFLVTENVFFY